VGYGRANNLVLPRLTSEFHLVLNPDVELDRDALVAALSTMRAQPGVGLLVPAAFGGDGAREYLCKRYPSVAVLFLRGFAPAFLRKRFAAKLSHYEMRDLIAERFVKGVPIASGCFLLARTALLARVGGFDPRYFMYFEDFDLSLRMAGVAEVAYEPAARIVHHGGGASRKGPRHVAWFIVSAFRFFSRHGWRWA
jgi:GT2 family glycosyltransferase